MLTGMYVSIDRDATSAGTTFWRTQNGGFVERGALSPLHNAPTFQGVALDAEHPLPTGVHGRLRSLDVRRRRPTDRTATRRERAPRLTVVQLTADPPVRIGRNEYYRTHDGFYVSARNIRTWSTRTRRLRTSGPTKNGSK